MDFSGLSSFIFSNSENSSFCCFKGFICGEQIIMTFRGVYIPKVKKDTATCQKGLMILMVYRPFGHCSQTFIFFEPLMKPNKKEEMCISRFFSGKEGAIGAFKTLCLVCVSCFFPGKEECVLYISREVTQEDNKKKDKTNKYLIILKESPYPELRIEFPGFLECKAPLCLS